MKALLLSALVGFIVAAGAVGFVSTRAFAAKRADLTRGWNPKKIVVAALDISRGAVLKPEHLTLKEVPEQFVTASNLTEAEGELVFGNAAAVPMLAGDPMMLQSLALDAPRGRAEACAEKIVQAVGDADGAARSEAVAAFVKNARGSVQPIAAQEPKAAGGNAPCVVATKDLVEGSIMQDSDLAASQCATALVTASAVPAEEKQTLAGARLIVPVQKGDVIWWQMLDDADHPSRTASCADAVIETVHKARLEAAKRAAAEVPL